MRALAAVALALALVSSPADAQAPAATPKPFTVEVDVNVVSVTVVVHDKAGRFIHGLTSADVKVLEDGVPQDVSFFREAAGGAEKIPLSVVLVLDASGSMKENLPLLQQAANSFIQRMQDVDQALVMQFNNTVKASAEFSSDPDRLEDFVDSLQAWGGTSLYDAVHYGLERVQDQAGRKAVIVFSDGADTTSSLREDDVIAFARSVEATVYSVGIPGGGPGGSARGFLKRVAAETGGDHFFPDRVGDLIKVFNAISEELHNHYALAYSPKRDPDGAWRAIAVTVNRPDAQVRVRKGYVAAKKRRPQAPR